MRKGIKRLSLGIIVGLFGIIAVPGLTVFRLINENKEHRIAPFKVPGEQRLELTKPGKHTIWYHERIVFEGESYVRDEGIPDGWVFTLTQADGQSIPLHGDESASVSSSNNLRRSFLYFNIEHPGSYDLKVTGKGEDHILQIAPAFTFEAFTKILAAVAASVISIIIGIGLVIWGIVLLTKAR